MKDKQIELLEQLVTAQILTLAEVKSMHYKIAHPNSRTTDNFISASIQAVVDKQPAILQLLLEKRTN